MITTIDDFGDATFTFKIDPAFYFEMNDKVQVDAREKKGILKTISTTPGDLTLKYTDHEGGSPDSLTDFIVDSPERQRTGCFRFSDEL